MGVSITKAEYFGIYAKDPSVTPEIEANAEDLLRRVNAVYEKATMDGCYLPDNPKTGSGVSGTHDGGFRPPQSTTGATNSTHRKGQGVDRYDPERTFASWCFANQSMLVALGLSMEDPRWTPSWVHLQSVPVPSGHTVYVPSTAPALVGYPAHWGPA